MLAIAFRAARRCGARRVAAAVSFSSSSAPQLIRKAFVMSVDPGKEVEYERRHSPIWAELESTLIDHGVTNYSIHLHAETCQLFAYAEIESEERWAAIADTDVCRRWWAHMGDIMPSNPDGSPVATDLREVFHISK